MGTRCPVKLTHEINHHTHTMEYYDAFKEGNPVTCYNVVEPSGHTKGNKAAEKDRY